MAEHLNYPEPVIEPDGIVEQDSDGFTVYPNPASDQLHLQLAEPNQPFTCRLYDLQGRLLLQQDNATNLNVASFQAGVYEVQVQSNNEVYTTKFVKQ